MACSAGPWLDPGNKKVAMENVTHKQTSALHQERKRTLQGVFLLLLTAVLSIGLTLAWFTLIGYGFLALLGQTAI
jgi:hypothetical protein